MFEWLFHQEIPKNLIAEKSRAREVVNLNVAHKYLIIFIWI